MFLKPRGKFLNKFNTLCDLVVVFILQFTKKKASKVYVTLDKKRLFVVKQKKSGFLNETPYAILYIINKFFSKISLFII